MVKGIKDSTQELIKEGNVSKNITTTNYLTTTYYIKSWGYFNRLKKLIIEQVDERKFIFNKGGERGIRTLQNIEDEREVDGKIKKIIIGKGFIIDNDLFIISGRVHNSKLFYNVPEIEECEKWILGQRKNKDFLELLKEIEKSLKEMFDFTNELDIETSKISISQSWIKPILNEFFFYGIDSTKGGGKTTLGEIVYFLMRHGFVGGNISPAAIPRLVHELDLNIFVDEIDQNIKDEDTMAILRKGQRRGNPYVRCEGRDNHPVAYNVAGCHGFSYRTEVEDAFMDRALRIHTQKSMNSQLPVINCFKKELLKNLADDLFFWFIDNINVVGCSEERGVVGKSNPTTFSREQMFSALTNTFSDEEKKFLQKIFGRDTELAFLCLRTSKRLNFDILENLKKIIQKKKDDELSSEAFYLEALRELIIVSSKKEGSFNILIKTLADGQNLGCAYYPKNKLYADYVKHLKELDVQTIGTKKYNSLLRDLGFVEGISLTSQRYGSYPTACLIFTKEICEKIGIEFKVSGKLE